VCMSVQCTGECTRGGLTPQSGLTELGSRHAKLCSVILMIRQMCLYGVMVQYGSLYGWAAPDGLEYPTLPLQAGRSPSPPVCSSVFKWLSSLVSRSAVMDGFVLDHLMDKVKAYVDVFCPGMMLTVFGQISQTDCHSG